MPVSGGHATNRNNRQSHRPRNRVLTAVRTRLSVWAHSFCTQTRGYPPQGARRLLQHAEHAGAVVPESRDGGRGPGRRHGREADEGDHVRGERRHPPPAALLSLAFPLKVASLPSSRSIETDVTGTKRAGGDVSEDWVNRGNEGGQAGRGPRVRRACSADTGAGGVRAGGAAWRGGQRGHGQGGLLFASPAGHPQAPAEVCLQVSVLRRPRPPRAAVRMADVQQRRARGPGEC